MGWLQEAGLLHHQALGSSVNSPPSSVKQAMHLGLQVRRTLVEWLKEEGLFRGTADNAMSIPLCSRSKDIIEPVLKPQWWVSCAGMAQMGVQAVKERQLEIVPREFEATWYR